MALTVETGAGLAQADSYVSVADFDAYFLARYSPDLNIDDNAKERALRRATKWVDAEFRARFPGCKRIGRLQGLEWPRSNAADRERYAIDAYTVPKEIVEATCEAAQRELTEEGSLAPDQERGGSIKRIKAGSVEIEYGADAINGTTRPVIEGILAPILCQASAIVGRAVRC